MGGASAQEIDQSFERYVCGEASGQSLDGNMQQVIKTLSHLGSVLVVIATGEAESFSHWGLWGLRKFLIQDSLPTKCVIAKQCDFTKNFTELDVRFSGHFGETGYHDGAREPIFLDNRSCWSIEHWRGTKWWEHLKRFDGLSIVERYWKWRRFVIFQISHQSQECSDADNNLFRFNINGPYFPARSEEVGLDQWKYDVFEGKLLISEADDSDQLDIRLSNGRLS